MATDAIGQNLAQITPLLAQIAADQVSTSFRKTLEESGVLKIPYEIMIL
jgi:hypothetical protein